MQQTSKYQFNLVEGSDDFSPTPLNQNMEKVEEQFDVVAEALAALEGAYVTGTYTGNGKTMAQGGQLIETGFPPKFVIITRGWLYSSGLPSSFIAAGQNMVEGTEDFIAFENNGFTVAAQDSGHIQLNTAGTTYSYVAFR